MAKPEIKETAPGLRTIRRKAGDPREPEKTQPKAKESVKKRFWAEFTNHRQRKPF